MRPSQAESVAQAREWLTERVYDGGAPCPCCSQFAKVYRRRIHGTMASELVQVWHAVGFDWFRAPTVLGHPLAGDFAKLVHWSLIEPDATTIRDDGSTRNGWWRITADGASYVAGIHTVPKYALIYDGRCLGHEGEPVGIRDALRQRFNYDQLMAGV